ncbi:HAMP domain-containing histidine kinase [Calothrix sp. FACHB-1219]|uniref:sensor histidine kinase n=1 Tax=unclassified Calothrix TaxID=2619626 RepID=UPI0016877FD3|nr:MULTISPECIES: HAMP domain-containing sensor histidine kinase [unclassified Calothrix]MBD2204202.1 HAMP domain-containing histidine kinase [Calothrix sp. FACHB-168]MBD2220508.1 HAMP domain-containing histidine kinase [Calothrix sp. FACHB-1219]
MTDSITDDLFAALNILVLERLHLGTFKITGTVPNWLRHFCHPRVTSGTEVLIPEQQFPFLENFLIDAEEFWQNHSPNKLSSGFWTDNDLAGREYHFEASAISLNNRKFLLIELLNDVYIEKQDIIQKARENQLKYQQLVKDKQKKEVLIHCIIHDIAGQLSSINCCLALLEFESLTPKGQERLEIGRHQTIKQETLIREILNAFSEEMRSLEAFTLDPEQAPNILASVQEVIKLLSPSFTLNNVKLQLASNIDVTADWRVIGDRSRLDRVMSNLVENALRHSPPDSTVEIGLQPDETSILVTIDDRGTGVAPEIANNLFQKFTQGGQKSGRSGLGLYFCRITVERWSGKIGYLPRPDGGSRFWFRLLRPET